MKSFLKSLWGNFVAPMRTTFDDEKESQLFNSESSIDPSKRNPKYSLPPCSLCLFYDEEDVAVLVSAFGYKPPDYVQGIVDTLAYKLSLERVDGILQCNPTGYAKGTRVFFFKNKTDFNNFKAKYPDLSYFTR